MTNPLENLQSQYYRLLGVRDSLRKKKADLEQQIDGLEQKVVLSQQVAALFSELIDREIADSVREVEKLITEGLRSVFYDQDISVRAETDIVRGKVSVQLITVQKQSDGTITEGVSLDAFGGAVSTIQSVLLRLLSIVNRGLRPVLLLDETLPALDDVYVHAVGKFLRLLAEKMRVDILLVTHNQALFDAAPKAYKIRPSAHGAIFDKVNKHEDGRSY